MKQIKLSLSLLIKTNFPTSCQCQPIKFGSYATVDIQNSVFHPPTVDIILWLQCAIFEQHKLRLLFSFVCKQKLQINVTQLSIISKSEFYLDLKLFFLSLFLSLARSFSIHNNNECESNISPETSNKIEQMAFYVCH